MNKLINVVIPVYDGEKFLKNSIECILNQTYEKLKLIIVNDGSIDNSLQICKSYEKQDKRIIVISNKENKGIAYSRNKGMDYAKNGLLYFLDVDDYISIYTFEIMMDIYIKNNKPDMLLTNYSKLDINNVYEKQKNIFIKNKKEYVRHFLKNPSNHLVSYCWARFYKLSIIKKYNIKANVSMNLFEDYNFNLKYLKYSKSISYTNLHLYTYFVHTLESASMKIIDAHELLKDMSVFKKETIKFLKGNEKEIHHCLIHYCFIFLIRSCISYKEKNKEKILKEFSLLINSPLFSLYLKDYKIKKGYSKILPFLCKYKLINLIFLYCRLKAKIRYHK